jgi:hypothetical protein
LIVDGKTLDTKPLRVMADKEVVLTEVERKRLYDMAMELHALHRQANETAAVISPLTRQMDGVAKQVADNAAVPADLKAQVEAFGKELTAVATKLIPPAGGGRFGGGGGGGRGADTTPIARLTTGKNGMMGSMWPTQATMTAYADAKTGVPAAIAEAQTVLTKARALSGALAKHNITLTVPPPAAKTEGLR